MVSARKNCYISSGTSLGRIKLLHGSMVSIALGPRIASIRAVVPKILIMYPRGE